jgi:hypothetical protein
MARWREILGVGVARLGLLGALLLILLWPAGIAGASGSDPPLNLTVRPAVGARRTHFVVSFTPQRSSLAGALPSAYEIVMSGGSARTCWSAQQMFVQAVGGQRVHVAVPPSGPHRLWCRGRYTGRLQQFLKPVCEFGKLCPLAGGLEPGTIILRPLKTFHVRVR